VSLFAAVAERAVLVLAPASVGPQVDSAGLPADSAAPVWSAPASAGLALVGWSAVLFPDDSDSPVASVAPTVGLVYSDSPLALWVENLPADLFPGDVEFRVESPADSVSSYLAFPADGVADSACPVSLAVSKAALADSVVWFPADFPAPMVAGSVPADFPDAAGDILSDDTSSCRDIPADSPKQSAEDDTKDAADGKDSTSLPRTRDCNKRGALPSSIPSRPSPKGGRPVMPQFQFRRRN
jgi:hypothetical protein